MTLGTGIAIAGIWAGIAVAVWAMAGEGAAAIPAVAFFGVMATIFVCMS
jgi:hypothetical protein